MTFWPQIVMVAIFSAVLTIALVNHGKAKDESYNFYWTLLVAGVEFWILLSGGFFDVFMK